MSRHLAVLKQMDIIKDEGKLTLTDHGRELAEQYKEEIVLLQKWFGQYLPECSEQDKHDSAQNMVVVLTPDFKAKMLEKIADMVQKNSMYGQIDSRGTLEFKDIVEYMVPGDYPVAFVIQKTEQSKDDSPFSMADEGFEHPAVLNVSQDGTGVFDFKTGNDRAAESDGKDPLFRKTDEAGVRDKIRCICPGRRRRRSL